jgi:hypothetical protein
VMPRDVHAIALFARATPSSRCSRLICKARLRSYVTSSPNAEPSWAACANSTLPMRAVATALRTRPPREQLKSVRVLLASNKGAHYRDEEGAYRSSGGISFHLWTALSCIRITKNMNAARHKENKASKPTLTGRHRTPKGERAYRSIRRVKTNIPQSTTSVRVSSHPRALTKSCRWLASGGRRSINLSISEYNCLK